MDIATNRKTIILVVLHQLTWVIALHYIQTLFMSDVACPDKSGSSTGPYFLLKESKQRNRGILIAKP